MRQSENGALSSLRLTPMSCDTDLLARAIGGTLMSVPQDQRTRSLPLACSGSGWRRVGYPGPKSETAQDNVIVESLSRSATGSVPEPATVENIWMRVAIQIASLLRHRCVQSGRRRRSEIQVS